MVGLTREQIESLERGEFTAPWTVPGTNLDLELYGFNGRYHLLCHAVLPPISIADYATSGYRMCDKAPDGSGRVLPVLTLWRTGRWVVARHEPEALIGLFDDVVGVVNGVFQSWVDGLLHPQIRLDGWRLA